MNPLITVINEIDLIVADRDGERKRRQVTGQSTIDRDAFLTGRARYTILLSKEFWS